MGQYGCYVEECGCNVEQCGCNVDPPHLDISQFHQFLSPPRSVILKYANMDIPISKLKMCICNVEEN